MLIRMIVLECLIHNVRVYAKYVPTDENGKADALSRLDMERFRDLGPGMNTWPCKMSDQLWPVEKVWPH